MIVFIRIVVDILALVTTGLIGAAIVYNKGVTQGRAIELAKDYSRTFDVPIDDAMYIVREAISN